MENPLKAVGTFIKESAQDFATSIAATGVSIGNVVRRATGRQPLETIKATSIEQKLTGREEIPSVKKKIEQDTQFLSPYVGNTLGTAIAGVFYASDVAPLSGFMKRGLVRKLQKVSDPVQVENILKRETTLPADAIKAIAPKIAKTQDVGLIGEYVADLKLASDIAERRRQDLKYLPEEYQESLQELREFLGLGKRPVETMQDTEKLAEVLGIIDTRKLLDLAKKVKVKKQVEVAAVRRQMLNLVKTQGQILRKASEIQMGFDIPHAIHHLSSKADSYKTADDFVSALTKEELDAIRRSGETPLSVYYKIQARYGKLNPEDAARQFVDNSGILDLEDEIARIVTRESELATEVGRALNIFKNSPKVEGEGAHLYWLARFKRSTKRDPTKSERELIVMLARQGQPQQIMRLIDAAKHSTKMDKFIALYKAGLLWQPSTLLINLLGNTTIAFLERIKNYPAAVADMIASHLTKRRTIVASGNFRKTLEALKPALSKSRVYIQTGMYASDFAERWGIPVDTKIGHPLLDLYTQAAFRSLGTTDIVFRETAMASALENSAMAIAKSEGLKGEAFKARVRELLMAPTDDMIMDAIDAAEYQTFTRQNIVSQMVGAAKRSARQLAEKEGATEAERIAGNAAYLASEVMIPFDRTPTNVIITSAIDYTPLGYGRVLSELAKAAFGGTFNQKKFAEAFGRSTTGSSLIAMGYYLASKDVMTGGFDESDRSMRDTRYTHSLPYSININGTWWQLNRLAPPGVLLGVGADLYERLHKRYFADVYARTPAFVSNIVSSSIGQFVDIPFIQNTSRIIDIINAAKTAEGGKVVEVSVGRILASFVPGPVRILQTLEDPYLREQEELMDAIKNRFPFVSRTLVPIQDVWGDPVERPGGRLRFIDPLGHRKDINDPIIKEAERIGVPIGKPSNYLLGKIAFEPEEYYIFHYYQGKFLRLVLEQVVNSREYQMSPDYEKERILESAKRQAREAAMKQIGVPVLLKSMGLDPTRYQPEFVYHVIRVLDDTNQHFKNGTQEDRRAILKKALERL